MYNPNPTSTTLIRLVTTLIRLVEEWKMELDCGKLVGMLSTDMSKAFDSLYSPLLIKKLESYRFSDKDLDLVRSYFHNRRRIVHKDVAARNCV